MSDRHKPAPRAGLLALLLVPVALLTDLGAALPLRTYFFRDFSVTFYPLRLFAARELREGRLAGWNPFVFEGSFAVPSLYPADLLHALWPGPAFVSWLLTLHLPLAALAAFWLARELGTERLGAFVAGACFALGGFALSSLNLYVFLQALALAPLVVGLVRRAATRGGRAIATAAVLVAVALATLAVEFVAQSLLLGLALGIAARPDARGVLRMSIAIGLGAGLAGLPLLLTLGLLPETVRGAGFARAVALGNAVHPAVLVQTLLPNLFGSLSAPAGSWWGGRFFSKGMPYFLSLYLGPVVLALGAVGWRVIEPRARLALAGLGLLGAWYALGEAAGLAAALARLPAASWFRFPSKALLLPHLALALAAGCGVDRLRRGVAGWGRLAVAAAALGAIALAVFATLALGGADLVAWTGVAPEFWPAFRRVVGFDVAWALLVCALIVSVALAVRSGRLSAAPACALLAGLAVADLARAGRGMNPQTDASFFEPVPALAALRLDELGGGRVFSYGTEHSPAFLAFLQSGVPRLGEAAFLAYRQVLGPYTNLLDSAEAVEATDLTSFVPRARELGPEEHDPERVGDLVPWLRQAAVARVLSFDPLAHPDLDLLAAYPAGPSGPKVHAYRLAETYPKAYVACRVRRVADAAAALAAPFTAGFDPGRDVALEVTAVASCSQGTARRLADRPGEGRYEVSSDGPAVLVVRESHARGWRADVDGEEGRVLRANGKHRAVPIPEGRHEVRLRYEPPGLRAGLVTTTLSLFVLVALLRRRS